MNAQRKISDRDPESVLPRRSNAGFQSVSAEKHPCLWIRQAGYPVPPFRQDA
jgi:hypothetical protein